MMTRRSIRMGERVNPVGSAHIWETPSDWPIEIVIGAPRRLYQDIAEHLEAMLPDESGGFLLGEALHDAQRSTWLLSLREAVPLHPALRSPLGFVFTWRDVLAARRRRDLAGWALLGWYHSHPRGGVFLSETDLEKTHRILFSDLFQVALVCDPTRRRAGYFCWRGHQEIDPTASPDREFDFPGACGEDILSEATLNPSKAKMDARH